MLLYSIIGFVAISLLGSLFHFVYGWSKNNKIVGFFVSVNESTWEHMKLAIFPVFMWAVCGLFLHANNFAFGVLVALVTVMAVIPAIFYGYTHFAKRSILAVDISSFFIAVGAAMVFAYLIFTAPTFHTAFNVIGIIGILLLVTAFSLFTFYPPHGFLFKDPITKTYGISKEEK